MSIVVFAPWIAPYPEYEILTDESFALSSEQMWLGSDFLGRDVFSRMLYGARVTFSVAFAIALIAFFIGCTFGFLAAVKRGLFDSVLSRIVDVLISFPAIMVALIVISGLGSSITVLIVTVALIDATRVFRVARALGMDIVVQDYIEAATVRGEKLGWIMWHEILPNALAPLAAEFGIRFTYAILFISALSFLGLGVQPPQADLGVMVKENMQGLLYETYTPLYPALCIAMVTLSVNLLVDWYLKTTDATLPDEL
ncbi:MAG: peptide/nickel transport system permease protein [Flavobacteriaceae bacterium]